MADHFYSIAAVGEGLRRNPADIVVGTSSTAGNKIELRITDGAMTRRQAYAFVEYLADLLTKSESNQVIASGTLLS